MKHPPREVARVMELVHLLLQGEDRFVKVDWQEVLRTVVRLDFLKRARSIDLPSLLQKSRLVDGLCRSYFGGPEPLTPDRVRFASRAVVAFFGWSVAVLAGVLPALPEAVGGHEARRRIELLHRELTEERQSHWERKEARREEQERSARCRERCV